jgi:glycosyltransferase involved in cell wall biosynthesis
MVAHTLYQFDGRVRSYVDTIVASGGRVDVVCLSSPDQAVNWPSGVRVLPIPLGKRASHPREYISEYAIATGLFALRLLRLHLKRRYDIIHVHNMPDFLVVSAAIPRLLGARIILDIHDPMPEFVMARFGGYREGSVIVRFLQMQERASARLADAILTANARFARNLVRRGIPPEKITVIRNVPDPAIFDRATWQRNARRSKDRFTLIYPGTVAPRYGLEVALRGLCLLAERFPQLRLTILARPDGERATLGSVAERLGVAGLVELRDMVPTDELPRDLAQADAGIYTALPDAHMSIAEPVKVLEYVAMGIPVIASRLPVLEDTFSSALSFFEPGSAEGFARRVAELIENTERKHELVRNADAAFDCGRSWSLEQQRYLDLLARMAAPRRSVSAGAGPER